MPYTNVTLAQLRQQLKWKFESVPFFTDVECTAAINEALQWYNLYTGVWRQRVVLNTVAGQVYYALPSTLVYNARVAFNGYPLDLSSLSDLDNGQPGWEGQTTASGGLVPTEVTTWAPVGMTWFALWPADAVGGNGLTIDGVHQTPVLTADLDTVDLDDSELNAVLGEALYLLCFKDPGRAPRAAAWHKAFIDNVIEHNGRLKAANAFLRPEGIDLNRSRVPISVEVKS